MTGCKLKKFIIVQIRAEVCYDLGSMEFNFSLKPNSTLRRGVLTTSHGQVDTPVFMPVGTLGAVKGITPEELHRSGVQIMLSNTYHLHLKPGEEVVSEAGGLAAFNAWRGPTLTDSGGYQVFSLSRARKITEEGVEFRVASNGQKVLLTPEKSIQIQFQLGADIIMAFDDVVGLSAEDRPREKEAMERTNRWLARCIEEYNRQAADVENPPALFGIVQGGLDKKLRAESLDFVQSQPVAGIAIGGLSVGETRPEMYDMLDFLAPLYDPGRPHYLMGVGTPSDVAYGIRRGIDMFDCVLPTRNARHGQAWTTDGKCINLRSGVYKNDMGPISQGCDCTTCSSGYSRAFLRHLFVSGEVLAGRLVGIHNIRHLVRLTDTILPEN
jgi:queuine tRNA-ribosyltransferase